ncbi:acyl-CoA thioesterase [Epsilonproteobacteria bacterium SCGC AD-311-C15]|jgi:acyl-coenzyme A thioesterase PaaI-like protein|nr:acyl-CoA thioesterase [Epsilonproteobacteria bacterium SCGC AD-311-C15]
MSTNKTAEEDEDLELEKYKEDNSSVTLRTHEEINRGLCGDIEKLEVGYVELRLTTTEDMVADSLGLIHGGFIFGAADYAAMAAINERNVVLVASECQFLSPVKLHDDVIIIAKVRHKEGRKRNVRVEGFVFDIKVFEGEFKTVITERHILKLHLLEESDDKKAGKK